MPTHAIIVNYKQKYNELTIHDTALQQIRNEFQKDKDYIKIVTTLL